jgi:hypothetical protein
MKWQDFRDITKSIILCVSILLLQLFSFWCIDNFTMQDASSAIVPTYVALSLTIFYIIYNQTLNLPLIIPIIIDVLFLLGVCFLCVKLIKKLREHNISTVTIILILLLVIVFIHILVYLSLGLLAFF